MLHEILTMMIEDKIVMFAVIWFIFVTVGGAIGFSILGWDNRKSLLDNILNSIVMFIIMGCLVGIGFCC